MIITEIPIPLHGVKESPNHISTVFLTYLMFSFYCYDVILSCLIRFLFIDCTVTFSVIVMILIIRIYLFIHKYYKFVSIQNSYAKKYKKNVHPTVSSWSSLGSRI